MDVDLDELERKAAVYLTQLGDLAFFRPSEVLALIERVRALETELKREKGRLDYLADLYAECN